MGEREREIMRKRERRTDSRRGERAAALNNIWEPSGSREEKPLASAETLGSPSQRLSRPRLFHVQLTPSPSRRAAEEGDYTA